MADWTKLSVRIVVAGGMLCTMALGGRLLPARAEPQGVLGQHLELLDRNAGYFGAKNMDALAKDLTEDYERTGLVGDKKAKRKEIAELQQLFATATDLHEASQTSRLTVQGGDATTPTVATTLVQTSRSATVKDPGGKLHSMTWEIVDNEQRISTPDGWRCRQRVELKNRVTMDGAPYLHLKTPAAAETRDRIQRAYNSLAKAFNTGDGNLARTILAVGFESRSIDDKSLTADLWLAEIERRRKEAWRSDGSYEIEAISVDGDRATVGSRHNLLRQAADKEGIIHMVRETDSSRDNWQKTAQGWKLLKSETLLAETDVVQPVHAAGWR